MTALQYVLAAIALTFTVTVCAVALNGSYSNNPGKRRDSLKVLDRLVKPLSAVLRLLGQ